MARITAPQTTPTLLSLTPNEPVLVTEVGTGHSGLLWIVAPEDFGTLTDFVNTYGGPAFYRITPLSELSADQMRRIKSERPEDVAYVQSFQ